MLHQINESHNSRLGQKEAAGVFLTLRKVQITAHQRHSPHTAAAH